MTTPKTYTTKDTNETVRFMPPPPDHWGDGYEWMNDVAPTAGWHPCSGWGKDGWDAGSWPYVILTLAKGQDEAGPFFGITTYCEGDLSTSFYRKQSEQWKAITEWCRWNWEHGQSDGPTLTAEEVEADRERYGRPFGDEYDGKVGS